MIFKSVLRIIKCFISIFFSYYSLSDTFILVSIENSKGTSNQSRFNEKSFLQITNLLPDYEKQLWIVSIAKRLKELGKMKEAIREKTEGLFKSILDKTFQGEL
jgi:restriction endonuclease S subunit